MVLEPDVTYERMLLILIQGDTVGRLNPAVLFVWTWVLRKRPIPHSCRVVGLSVRIKMSSPGWWSIGRHRKLACRICSSIMICHHVCNWCKSARRGIFNIVSLRNTNAPGDMFKLQWMATLEAYAAVAKHVSIISLVCSILLGGYAHNIDQNLLLTDWCKRLHMV